MPSEMRTKEYIREIHNLSKNLESMLEDLEKSAPGAAGLIKGDSKKKLMELHTDLKKMVDNIGQLSQQLTPKQAAQIIRLIASKIEASNNPSVSLVKTDLEKLVFMLNHSA